MTEPVPTPPVPCDPDLFDLLVCPQSRKAVKFCGGRLVSTDPQTRRSYPIDAGIPVMLIEESQILSDTEWQRLMAEPGPVSAGAAAVLARHAGGAAPGPSSSPA